jgi:hypothetical protein
MAVADHRCVALRRLRCQEGRAARASSPERGQSDRRDAYRHDADWTVPCLPEADRCSSARLSVRVIDHRAILGAVVVPVPLVTMAPTLVRPPFHRKGRRYDPRASPRLGPPACGLGRLSLTGFGAS